MDKMPIEFGEELSKLLAKYKVRLQIVHKIAVIPTSIMETKKYKVLGEIFPLNEDGTKQEVALEVGSIQEVPEEVGATWIAEGLAEEVTE